MCTLSWAVPETGGYLLFFSRDEQRTRTAALPPFKSLCGDVETVMPLDPVGNGSWIASNEYGLTVCLLNFYQGQTPKGPIKSRGQVIRTLAGAESYEQATLWLKQIDLTHTAPFSLAIFDKFLASNFVNVWCWDGLRLNWYRSRPPLVSAGKYLHEAQQYRYALYEKYSNILPLTEIGSAFHQSFNSETPYLSPMMSRDDAHTVSLTRVILQKNRLQMHYESFDDAQKVVLDTTSELTLTTLEIQNEKNCRVISVNSKF